MKEIVLKIKEIEDFVYKNKTSFKKHFIKNKYIMDFINIYFNSESFYIHYVLEEGCHIQDQISLDKFFEWMDNERCILQKD